MNQFPHCAHVHQPFLIVLQDFIWNRYPYFLGWLAVVWFRSASLRSSASCSLVGQFESNSTKVSSLSAFSNFFSKTISYIANFAKSWMKTITESYIEGSTRNYQSLDWSVSSYLLFIFHNQQSVSVRSSIGTKFCKRFGPIYLVLISPYAQINQKPT